MSDSTPGTREVGTAARAGNCPTCGASPGELCASLDSGALMAATHADREIRVPPQPLPSSTPGIPRAQAGALQVLQSANFTFPANQYRGVVEAAAREISGYHAVGTGQAERLKALECGLATFLAELVYNCPPGSERSTAISRAREAKFWGAAAIALEGK